MWLTLALIAKHWSVKCVSSKDFRLLTVYLLMFCAIVRTIETNIKPKRVRRLMVLYFASLLSIFLSHNQNIINESIISEINSWRVCRSPALPLCVDSERHSSPYPSICSVLLSNELRSLYLKIHNIFKFNFVRKPIVCHWSHRKCV